MTTTKTPIQADENRICLLNEVPAARVMTALANTKARLELIERETSAAHRAAMDPTASDEQIAKSRAEVTDLAFERERLANAVEHLTERHASLTAGELKASQREEYEAAKAERDALAKEIAERYPAISKELIGLFKRIAASDQRCDAANKHLGGAEYLSSAEALARGCAGNFLWLPSAINVVRLTSVKLPNFDVDGIAWPPRDRFS